MISFIIIGRNEGWRLELCLQSVVKAIKQCSLNAEVIYIDSQSNDNSLEISKSYKEVKSYLITGKYNAAIARNIGVKEAIGDDLVFLDGDMEISPEFLDLIIERGENLRYEFISGNFINNYYDKDDNFLKKDFYRKIYCEKDTLQYTTGGLFAIKREHWERVGGMHNKYKKGQDLDFGFRLAKKGIFLLRKKEVMAQHHTIDYKNKNRLWRSFIDGSYLYPRAILYRDHVLNKYVMKRMLSSDPTLLIFIIAIIISIFFKSIVPIFIYLSLSAIAVAFSMRNTGFNGYVNRLIVHILRDLYNVFAILFFYPTNRIELKYKRV